MIYLLKIIKIYVLLDDVLEQLLVLNDYLDYYSHKSKITKLFYYLVKFKKINLQIDQQSEFLDLMK